MKPQRCSRIGFHLHSKATQLNRQTDRQSSWKTRMLVSRRRDNRYGCLTRFETSHKIRYVNMFLCLFVYANI